MYKQFFIPALLILGLAFLADVPTEVILLGLIILGTCVGNDPPVNEIITFLAIFGISLFALFINRPPMSYAYIANIPKEQYLWEFIPIISQSAPPSAKVVIALTIAWLVSSPVGWFKFLRGQCAQTTFEKYACRAIVAIGKAAAIIITLNLAYQNIEGERSPAFKELYKFYETQPRLVSMFSKEGHRLREQAGNENFIKAATVGALPAVINRNSPSYKIWQSTENKITKALWEIYAMRSDLPDEVRQEIQENTAGKADTEKITEILKWLNQNITYTAEAIGYQCIPGCYSVKEVIKTKEGVCFEYARVFAALAEACGINAKIIIGWSGTTRHAWNMVYLDNKWQYIEPQKPQLEAAISGTATYHPELSVAITQRID